MGRPRLFVEDCSDHSERKPRNFGFLIRPTLEEFNAFVHTLDKLLSENINRDFFGNEIAFETETVRSANLLRNFINVCHQTYRAAVWGSRHDILYLSGE